MQICVQKYYTGRNTNTRILENDLGDQWKQVSFSVFNDNDKKHVLIVFNLQSTPLALNVKGYLEFKLLDFISQQMRNYDGAIKDLTLGHIQSIFD